MGTVFSVELRSLEISLVPVIAWWHRVDEVFSTYRHDSAISRLGRGEVTLEQCPPEVAEVLDLCTRAQSGSAGWFTALPGGVLDPSGLVKGWSVEVANAMLVQAGSTAHAINGGGDVRCVGAADAPWRIGIADPLVPGELAATVSGTDFALATSGVAERGCHVVDPYTGRPADALASVTLVGADLTWVDAYATAALAMGQRCRDWVERLDGYEALVIDPDGRRWRSSGWRARTGDTSS